MPSPSSAWVTICKMAWFRLFTGEPPRARFSAQEIDALAELDGDPEGDVGAGLLAHVGVLVALHGRSPRWVSSSGVRFSAFCM